LNPPRDEYGEVVKWYGSSTDIEDRKRAEERLRKDAQELKRSEFYLVEGQRLGRIGCWFLTLPEVSDYWSREGFHIHGLDPAHGPLALRNTCHSSIHKIASL
jgi:hypothetical protein